MSFRSPMELLAIGKRNYNNFHNFSLQTEVVNIQIAQNRCIFTKFFQLNDYQNFSRQI